MYLVKPTNSAGWENLYTVLNEFVQAHPAVDFRGVMRRVGLPDVIQMECVARSSSVVEVSNDRVAGKIFIAAGQIVHAQVGNASGEAALNQLLALSGGQFNLKPFTEPAHRTITAQWEFLLMEAARKSDEAREALAAAPPPPAAPEQAVVAAEVPPQQPPAKTTALSEPRALPKGDLAAARYEPVPVLPPGVAWRPKVDELLILSAQGEVIYEWQCPNVDLWVSFFEFASKRGQRLAQLLPLGDFNRLEIHSGGARAVVMISDDHGVLVKTRREAA